MKDCIREVGCRQSEKLKKKINERNNKKIKEKKRQKKKNSEY